MYEMMNNVYNFYLRLPFQILLPSSGLSLQATSAEAASEIMKPIAHGSGVIELPTITSLKNSTPSTIPSVRRLMLKQVESALPGVKVTVELSDPLLRV